MKKIIIYQTLPRIFGYKNESNTHNGTIAQNGCGKMNDYTTKALRTIKELGCNYIWYTGIIEHAQKTDYSFYGIPCDNPVVVKGNAGSPYAIKDYYDIDPDIAVNVPNRMDEFKKLIARTHRTGLKVIIDFVPNHVARQYYSDAHPVGIRDLGEDDNTTVAFSKHNNFYYIPGQQLSTADFATTDKNIYIENPAKVTGNDCFTATPGKNDWYETVKLNYGIDYQNGHKTYFDNDIPSTWNKMLDILNFWALKGIDGFRCDMAEMVPCQFWEWVIPQIKTKHKDIIFIAEVYNPQEYHNYIYNGKFDYLYNKVGLYDTLRAVVAGDSASKLIQCWQSVDDINSHMLNFLENHDEQRIASDFFAGDALKGRPALLVSALMNTNPFMIYSGQELGERGMNNEGFSGRDGRTTIFDYWTLEKIRRWRNNDKFDGRELTGPEINLYSYYKKVLNICNDEAAIRKGLFFDLMYANYDNDAMNTNRQYAFLRKDHKETILVVANFEDEFVETSIRIPKQALDYMHIKSGTYGATDLLTNRHITINMAENECINCSLPASSGLILKF